MGKIYADYAAATPLDPKVKIAMIAAMDEYANPSSIHTSGHRIELMIDDLQAQVARLLGAKKNGVIFTSGSTEANNLAMRGFGGQALALATDHKSTIDLAQQTIGVDEHGQIDFADLHANLTPEVGVISVAYVNNETGVIQPIKGISTAITQFNDENDAHVKLHIDASQAQLLPINLAKLGADLITISAGKIYGPKGAGVLAFNVHAVPRPQIVGGGQQGGLRGGTESLTQITGVTTALNISRSQQRVRAKHIAAIRQHVVTALKKSGLDLIIVGGKQVSAHILQVIFPGIEAERLVLELDARGVEASSGSACTASEDGPSHVLSAMGYDTISSSSGLRLSFSHLTDQAEADHMIQTVITTVQSMQNNQG